jgi:hypothetical protein
LLGDFSSEAVRVKKSYIRPFELEKTPMKLRNQRTSVPVKHIYRGKYLDRLITLAHLNSMGRYSLVLEILP